VGNDGHTTSVSVKCESWVHAQSRRGPSRDAATAAARESPQGVYWPACRRLAPGLGGQSLGRLNGSDVQPPLAAFANVTAVELLVSRAGCLSAPNTLVRLARREPKLLCQGLAAAGDGLNL
jgi:hypothetical protein